MRGLSLCLLALPVLLAGCGLDSAAARQSRYAAMVGGSEASLIAALGPPTGTRQAAGGKELLWTRKYTEWVQASPFNMNPPELLGLDYNGLPPHQLVWACQLRFGVAAGKVVSFAQSGNDC